MVCGVNASIPSVSIVAAVNGAGVDANPTNCIPTCAVVKVVTSGNAAFNCLNSAATLLRLPLYSSKP